MSVLSNGTMGGRVSLGLRTGAVFAALWMLLWAPEARAFCAGDCNADNQDVSIDELVKVVDIILNADGDPASCPEGDANDDGTISIGDAVQDVNSALLGCPETAACVLSSTSRIRISTAGLPLPLSLEATGSVDINCSDPDSETGESQCDCEIRKFNPLVLTGVGYICISPITGCDPGVLECNGGTDLSVDLNANHNIGPCTSNDDCNTQCQAHCDSLGKVPALSPWGCEGFCSAGAQSACVTDKDCLDRDEGACNGPDNVPDGHICECTCVDTNSPPTEPTTQQPGDMVCNLGSKLIVELGPPINMNPCTGNPDVQLIDVGSACVPLTTQVSTSVLERANNVRRCSGDNEVQCFSDDDCVPFGLGTCQEPMDEIGPLTQRGNPLMCDSFFQTGRAKDLKVRGPVSFYGSTIGDIASEVVTNCR